MKRSDLPILAYTITDDGERIFLKNGMGMPYGDVTIEPIDAGDGEFQEGLVLRIPLSIVPLIDYGCLKRIASSEQMEKSKAS